MAEIQPVVCHNMAVKPRPVSLAQVVAPLYKMYDPKNTHCIRGITTQWLPIVVVGPSSLMQGACRSALC